MRTTFGLTLLLTTASVLHAADGITVDKDKKTVTIDAKVAPRKIDDPQFKGEVYPVEVIACWPFPRGRKAHETVVSTDVKPSDVHKAMEDLGLKPGKPVSGEGEPQGPEVTLWLEIPAEGGQTKKVAVERTLVDPKTGKPLPKLKWRFTGSAMSKPDPNKDDMVYGADLSGTLISIFPVTNETVFQTNLTLKEEKFLKLDTDKLVLPKEGTAVKLIIEVVGK